MKHGYLIMRNCKVNIISKCVKRQQIKYAAHLIRAPNDNRNKLLLCNYNPNTKKHREATDVLDTASKELNGQTSNL